jgi:guanosine-3',5'-bis(diphosphate) 3'-pyrophosphohydrolase
MRIERRGVHLMTTDTGLLFKALEFAARKHRDQRRKDKEASPYINHPIALANVLCNEAGITDSTVLAAAILHDTVEDTDTQCAELDEAFGAQIRIVVLEVTDDKTLKRQERKDAQVIVAPHLSHEAKLVKLADKICNLRDVATSPPHDWSLQRRQEYFDWAKRVVAGVRGAHSTLEAIFDAAYARRPSR